MQFTTPLLPLHEMLACMWDENNCINFFQPTMRFFWQMFSLKIPFLVIFPRNQKNCDKIFLSKVFSRKWNNFTDQKTID
jgi:hypothetical protein